MPNENDGTNYQSDRDQLSDRISELSAFHSVVGIGTSAGVDSVKSVVDAREASAVSRIDLGFLPCKRQLRLQPRTPRATWNKLPSKQQVVLALSPAASRVRLPVQKRERQWVVFWRPALAPSQARSSAASPEASSVATPANPSPKAWRGNSSTIRSRCPISILSARTRANRLSTRPVFRTGPNFRGDLRRA